MRSIIHSLSLATFAFGLMGCNQTESPITNTKSTQVISSIDPCSLLMKDDVAVALSEQVTEAKVRTSPRPNCQYTVGEGSVTVFIFNDRSAAGAFESGKTLQDTQTEPVTGAGDQAYWSPGIKTLNVLKGKTYFTVQFYGVRSGSKETMKALAEKAASRIP